VHLHLHLHSAFAFATCSLFPVFFSCFHSFTPFLLFPLSLPPRYLGNVRPSPFLLLLFYIPSLRSCCQLHLRTKFRNSCSYQLSLSLPVSLLLSLSVPVSVLLSLSLSLLLSHSHSLILSLEHYRPLTLPASLSSACHHSLLDCLVSSSHLTEL
jgi:hypothetical protein